MEKVRYPARVLCFTAFCLAVLVPVGPPFAQTGESPDTAGNLSLQAELLFWESMKDSRDPAELRAYIDAYPDGRFVPLARARLRSLAPAVDGAAGAAATPATAGELEENAIARGRSPELRVGDRFRDCDTCPPMVVIPAGQFRMGAGAADAEAVPAHDVTLPNDVALSVYEIRVGDWEACVRSGDCPRVPGAPTDPALPIGNLSWVDAQAYVAWLSEETGHAYRLPTEAEWEYAARAGTTTPFWWGEEPGTAQARCADCGNPEGSEGPERVGSFAPNPFGLYDVHGNLSEWTEDCWSPSYQGAPADGSAWTGGDCISRVLRGGSYGRDHRYMTTASRNRYDHDVRYPEHGLRVVSELAQRMQADAASDSAPFAVAVEQAAAAVFANAPATAADAVIVMDPVVDGVSGARSAASRAMEAQLTAVVAADYPQYRIQDLAQANAAASRYVLIGTFTGINKQGKPAGEREAFRICLALIDRQAGAVVAKSKVFAQPAGVDITPTPFFRDSPVWTADTATQSYIDSCQKTQPGEPADPRYLERIEAAALLDDAIDAYEKGAYETARDLFRKAAATTGGAQLRTYNGLYLATWKLGDMDAATDAFTELLRFGLEQGAIAVNFQFRQGTAQFLLDPDSGAQHQLWLTRIADAADARGDCLQIVGHMDRTAADTAGEELGLRRADYVRRRLEAEAPALAARLTATVGSAEDDLIGSATGDGKDALDRRIEVRVEACSGRSASRR